MSFHREHTLFPIWFSVIFVCFRWHDFWPTKFTGEDDKPHCPIRVSSSGPYANKNSPRCSHWLSGAKSRQVLKWKPFYDFFFALRFNLIFFVGSVFWNKTLVPWCADVFVLLWKGWQLFVLLPLSIFFWSFVFGCNQSVSFWIRFITVARNLGAKKNQKFSDQILERLLSFLYLFVEIGFFSCVYWKHPGF